MRVNLFTFLLALLLAACAPAAARLPVSTATLPPPPTVYSTPDYSTPDYQTPAPPTPTETPVPCDPAAGFCIIEGTFLLQRPLNPPENAVIDRTYAYGSTLGGSREPHHGIEFPARSGTPVLAAAAGTVRYAGDDAAQKFSPWNNFYGNLVVIEHTLGGQTLYTLYAHLSRLDVHAGQTVAAGEKIGEVGMSGSAAGPHLHLEVRLDPQDYDSALNPQLWLLPLPETGVLAMRFVDAKGQPVRAQPNVQYFPDPAAPYAWAWPPELYAPAMPPAWESALLGDLPAGLYRLTHIWKGVLYERWVEVQPGKLTLVTFEVP